MFYYQILPSRKLPQHSLTYTHSEDLEPGRLVEVNIRGSLVWGIVLQKKTHINASKLDFDISQIKSITSILPYTMSSRQMSFVYSFSQNTFNSVNLSLGNFLQPMKLLTKKQWSLLEAQKTQIKDYVSELPENIDEKVDFILDPYITMRIIYIIRNSINRLPKNNVLIIFPEKKYLSKIWDEIAQSEDLRSQIQLYSLYSYTGDPNSESKTSVWSLINPENENSSTHNLYFSTRSGLFLPFDTLSTIILIDEASSFHIQDQNSVYFDTRDAVFLMSKAFKANLYFLSRLPSIRLYNFYSEKVLDDLMGKLSAEN